MRVEKNVQTRTVKLDPVILSARSTGWVSTAVKGNTWKLTQLACLCRWSKTGMFTQTCRRLWVRTSYLIADNTPSATPDRVDSAGKTAKRDTACWVCMIYQKENVRHLLGRRTTKLWAQDNWRHLEEARLKRPVCNVTFFPFILCVLHFFSVVLQDSTTLKNTFSNLKIPRTQVHRDSPPHVHLTQTWNIKQFIDLQIKSFTQSERML